MEHGGGMLQRISTENITLEPFVRSAMSVLLLDCSFTASSPSFLQFPSAIWRPNHTKTKEKQNMQNAQLLSHVDTDLVTREQLALVETPAATRSFKPVPHVELVNTLEHVLQLNHITIRKEQFALRRDGSTLFGVLQLAYQDTTDGMAALGIRTANNRTMSIQLCAGLSVFVCDNMVFRGDLIALNRKHTAGLHLRTEINHAILRFQDHFGRLTGEM